MMTATQLPAHRPRSPLLRRQRTPRGFGPLVRVVWALGVLASRQLPLTAQPTEINRGEMGLCYVEHKGLTLTYQTVPFLLGSGIQVRNAKLRKTFFSLGNAGVKVEEAPLEGQPSLRITPAPSESPPAFDYEYRVTLVSERELRFDLLARWNQRAAATLDWCLGWVSANTVKGQPYVAQRGPKPVHDVLPLGPSALTPRQPDFKLTAWRITLSSRLGPVCWQSNTTGAPLTMFDARRYHSAIDAGLSAYWVGFQDMRLAAGTEARYSATLGFEAGDRPWVRPLAPFEPKLEGGLVPASLKEAPSTLTVPDAKVPPLGPSPVIPRPQEREDREGSFLLNGQTRIVVADPPGDPRAATLLQERVQALYGLRLPIVQQSERPDLADAILLGNPSLSEKVAQICDELGTDVTPASPGPEGYILSVSPHLVTVGGCDDRGVYYGVWTLLQLIRLESDRKLLIPCTLIRDWPDFSLRAIHVMADNYALEWLSQLIPNVLARFKINTIVLECEYGKWDSHPELHRPWSMAKADMRSLKTLAERCYIEVVPLVQSLGHCEWMFVDGNHLDLAEDSAHPYAYCPSYEAAYQVPFDVMQEAIEVFQPKLLHIGHDEVTRKGSFGACPRCSKFTPAQLFVDNVRRLHGFLSERGVQTMMWGDMLLRPEETQEGGNGGFPHNIAEGRPGIPRDIVICDWHYSPYRDYPSTRVFAREGFPVVGATWRNKLNIYYLSQSVRNCGGKGMIQTTWAGYDGNRTILRRHPVEVSAYITAAEYWWSAGKPFVELLPYRTTEVLQESLRPRPVPLETRPGFLADLAPLCNVDVMDNGQQGGWLGYGHRYDLRRLPTGNQRLGNVLFRIADQADLRGHSAIMLAGKYTEPGTFPDSVTIPLGRKATQLVFLHTCGWEQSIETCVGSYVVQYADGTEEVLDLVYGDNLYSWDDRASAYATVPAWQNLTIAGVPVTLQALTWTNPNPPKVIARVVFRSTGTEASPILFALTGIDGEPAAPAAIAEPGKGGEAGSKLSRLSKNN